MKTGWMRYWICDKSGHGRDKWIYVYEPWVDDEDEAKHYILEKYEDWARFAEYYGFGVELQVIPPVDSVEKEIAKYEHNLESAYEVIKALRKLKNDLTGLDTQKEVR